ncbi:UDP-N-acetylglucosamine/UDP-N-acetylgalactosamine diphosphorylase [Abditibacterium utsteinense]|uniref:UDP-N-acetylglucosamine/UDP-N-acetylgalactosamine diphosphorylase n=1 Tax=Abditibacterium utsteinense TaxID=1960156 RepID=A0A2S8SPW0_9BACT|nr:UDPGP type 1 family protein [Abditibacterium utsteinense]PQV62835.1 UDP-N-acetylglucosamine/UDP-N-acetylgalactosamine diphosphorylase [Abditibacterium utsteinense]
MSTPSIIETFRTAGQPQVFAFWNELSPAEQENLLAQAGEIDLNEIAHLSETLLGDHAGASVDLNGLEPAPYEPLPENGGDQELWDKAKAVGEEALRAGRVAAFTVAGGQGTRLGYDGPKGTFPVTPLKHKTLFQVFAEKIRAAGERYQKPLHWFIMTSHQNHEATASFFVENAYFGLDENQVHLFRQGRMPAVDLNGKILLESQSSIALSPDGHGGSLRALDRCGALDLMEQEGIDTLSYFQVDSPLVHIIDPTFIGWHLIKGSQMSSKMIPKAYAEEKLGHFCTQDEHLVVIEYSDLPLEMQRQTDANGRLHFLAGSIAIHLLDREFVRQMARGTHSLPFHRADKKIPTVDAQGNAVKPEKPNGVKFEMFVFDALPFAKNPLVMETSRLNEFAPVKNPDGLDSPQTCKEAQLRQFARWANENGAGVSVDSSGLPDLVFEVSPLFGYDEDSFADSWRKSGLSSVANGDYLE